MNKQMVRKIIFLSAVLITLAGWPVSFIVNPPNIETGFVWQLNDAGEEKKLLLQKLALNASPLKKIFYNNKTTIPLDRYTKNILTMLDANNYFFGDRLKFPYPVIIGFVVGVYVSIKKKKYLKLWLYGFGVVIFASLFKKTDGWDTTMYPLLGIITSVGLKEISRQKLGWMLLILITILGLIQIGRLPL